MDKGAAGSGSGTTAMEWSVLIEAAAPEGGDHDDDTILEAAAELAELLTSYGAATAGNAGSWSVRLAVEGPDNATAAAGLAASIVEDHRAKAGLPWWPVTHLEATRWDIFAAELGQSNFPDLVGSQEVTEMLGVSRQRLHELRTSGRFPQPMLQLAATPVWLRAAVESFLETWERRPGRPKVEPSA